MCKYETLVHISHLAGTFLCLRAELFYQVKTFDQDATEMQACLRMNVSQDL